MIRQEFKLTRDCIAQTIPEAQSLPLKAGGLVTVLHVLGQAITLETSQGLARLDRSDLDALGADALDVYAEELAAGNTVASASIPTEDLLWKSLEQCYDPQIPVNIVDLGLVYDLKLEKVAAEPEAFRVLVKMTLANPVSAMGPILAQDVERALKYFERIRSVEVVFVWDPVWTPAMMRSLDNRL